MTACKATSTGQLLHHCSALITSASYSATLTFAYKIKRWTSPNRGHLMPAQDSIDIMLGKQEEQGHMSVKQNCWTRTERRWADMFTTFWGCLIWYQQGNVASFTVLPPTAIFNWKLKPLSSLGSWCQGEEKSGYCLREGRQRRSHGWQGSGLASQCPKLQHLSKVSRAGPEIMAKFNQEPRSAGRSMVTRQVWGQARKSGHIWARIYGVHKQAQTWLWLRWGISNSHSITQEWRLRAELKWDFWPMRRGCGWRSQVRLLKAIKTYQCTQGPNTLIHCTTTEMGT